MAVRRHAFKPIAAERGDRESFGWVNPRNLLASDYTWDDVVDGHLVYLAVRTDKKAFSKAIFRARRDAQIAEVCKAKGIERITRQQRLAIEEELTAQMLKEATPTTAVTELVWDRNTGEVFIGATSGKLCDRIADLFQSTFDRRLVPSWPAIIGHEIIAREGWPEGYAEASAAVVRGLANPPVGVGADKMTVCVAYAPLGPDFLTWLLVGAINGMLAGSFDVPVPQIVFVGGLVFEGESGEVSKASFAGDDPAGSREVQAALASGMRLVRARVEMTDQDNTWSFTLDARTFDVTGAKLPVPKLPDLDEALSLRVQALQQALHLLHEMFAAWLPLRCDKTRWVATVNGWKAPTEAAEHNRRREAALESDRELRNLPPIPKAFWSAMAKDLDTVADATDLHPSVLRLLTMPVGVVLEALKELDAPPELVAAVERRRRLKPGTLLPAAGEVPRG